MIDEEARKRAFENFTPRQNPQRQIASTTQPAPEVDINNQEELRKLATQTLVEIIQQSPRNVSLVAACRELLDRAVGKPIQAQEVKLNATIETHNITGLDDAETIRVLESALARRKRMITIEN
jgi:hypothetical protein